MDISEKYLFYWNVDESKGEIEIGLEVEAIGWIGWGISTTGQMTNSDVIVAWIDDISGDAIIQNRHTTENRWDGPQIMDDQSNIKLIQAFTNNTKMYFRFTRNLHPCSDNTIHIPQGTSRVIFAHTDQQSITDGILEPHQQEDCGSKSINLLIGETTEIPLPPTSDYGYFDIKMDEYEVPSHHTTYYCKLLAFPVLNDINHVIRVDPLIEEGNEGVVHHMTLTTCPDLNVVDDDIGLGEVCDDFANMPTEAAGCQAQGAIMAAWAIGGSNFYFPEHVGYEIGGNDSLAIHYAVLQMHYDNPLFEEGIIDSSGLRIYYTPILRNYSAELMTIGAGVDAGSIMVPGGMDEVIMGGWCDSECTEYGLPDEGVHVFGNFLHSHLLGRALMLRHFRNGKEITVLDRNDAYDFDYQQFWILSNEIHILPGDSFYVECFYDSSERNFTTYGGESTREEMCLTFMYVYPKVSLRQCMSGHTWNDFTEFIDDSLDLGYITNGEGDVRNFSNSWNYNISKNGALNMYNEYLNKKERIQTCVFTDTAGQKEVILPEIGEYIDDDDWCDDGKNSGNNNSNSFKWNSWYVYTVGIVIAVVLLSAVIYAIYVVGKRKNKIENNNKYEPTERENSPYSELIKTQP